MMDSKDIRDTEKHVQELVAKVEKWMLTEEGKEAVLKTMQEAAAVTKQLQESRTVDPKTLNDPVTL